MSVDLLLFLHCKCLCARGCDVCVLMRCTMLVHHAGIFPFCKCSWQSEDSTWCLIIYNSTICCLIIIYHVIYYSCFAIIAANCNSYRYLIYSSGNLPAFAASASIYTQIPFYCCIPVLSTNVIFQSFFDFCWLHGIINLCILIIILLVTETTSTSTVT